MLIMCLIMNKPNQKKKKINIWGDVICMKLFTSDGFGVENYDLAEKERARCKMMR